MLRDTPVEIVAVAVSDRSQHRLELPAEATLIDRPSELAAARPDVVAEAAGRESVGPWGFAAVAAGADFIVSSVSAFADAGLLEELRARAAANNVQVHIQPGALAGIDALRAARQMGIDAVEHRIVKPPIAWMGTPAENMCALGDLTEPSTFFRANAAETASQFPKNANVAMTTALAGIGSEDTAIALIADPSATTNRHEIRAHGTFGRLHATIENAPLAENPRTSAMAALSLVRSIENRVNPIVL